VITPQDLLAAYIAVTNIPVTLTPMRQMTLSMLVAVGITPNDITAIGNELKRRIANREKGYSDVSLDFRNFLGCPDTVEERALRLRQKAKRVQSPKPQVPTQRGPFMVLSDPIPPEPAKVDSTLIAEGFRTLANQIGRKAS